MDRVLRGLQWHVYLVYLDDIIVYSSSFDEHLKRLDLIFSRIKESGLKLQSKKCQMLQKEVSYLGHITSAEGVKIDPAKIEQVQNWPGPTSVRDVQSFLWLASYYRRFVSGFAGVARPLHKLTEKGRLFHWTEECQLAFDELKSRLVSSPILAYPSPTSMFVIDTDASDFRIGAVLSQQQDGEERVIAYASRALSKAERHYCVTRKEMLAVVYFVKYFRPYHYGQQFLLRTDHGALRWLFNFKEPVGQVARWLQLLAEYNFSIEHRPGRQHNNADAMSKRPCNQCQYPWETSDSASSPEIKLQSSSNMVRNSGDEVDSEIEKEEERPVGHVVT